jgi:hypothetical protein
MHMPTVLRRPLILLLLAALPLAGSAAEPARADKAAFLKSLVVPGWGQYSLGRKNAALAFFGADLALIGGMLSLRAYGSSARDDYKALAAAYAGVEADHGHAFYVDVGNWMTVDQFNQQRLLNRQYDALYTASSDRWAWDTDAHRAQMENTRIKSDRAFNTVLYLVGGLVLNHVASAIHAGRLAANERDKAAAPEQSSLSGPPPWTVALQPSAMNPGLSVKLSHNF